MKYMAAYESFKTAQVHLGTTLNEELENTDVAAFTIGRGFAPTQIASSSIPRLAAMMGKSEKEMQEILDIVKGWQLEVEQLHSLLS
jgi:NAD(P)-dependent dehydrogenase (short-subunit alcohol dehydrogenase family)